MNVVYVLALYRGLMNLKDLEPIEQTEEELIKLYTGFNDGLFLAPFFQTTENPLWLTERDLGSLELFFLHAICFVPSELLVTYGIFPTVMEVHLFLLDIVLFSNFDRKKLGCGFKILLFIFNFGFNGSDTRFSVDDVDLVNVFKGCSNFRSVRIINNMLLVWVTNTMNTLFTKPEEYTTDDLLYAYGIETRFKSLIGTLMAPIINFEELVFIHRHGDEVFKPVLPQVKNKILIELFSQLKR